jgi:branched-chain amino acid transport system substrate-binding protein
MLLVMMLLAVHEADHHRTGEGMEMRLTVKGFMAAALALILVACSEPSSQSTASGDSDRPCGETLKIGVHNTISTAVAPYGESAMAGMELWQEDVNADGGVLGSEVEFVVRDDAFDPSQAAAVAREFVQKEINLVAGPLGPTVSASAAPVYARDGVLSLMGVAGGETLESETTDTTFTLGASRDAQAKFIADYVRSRGWTNIGVVYSADAFGSAFVESFQNQASGLEVMVEEMTAADEDVTPQLSKLRRAGAEALVTFILVPTPDLAAVLSSADSIKWVVPIFGPVANAGGPWSDHPELAELAGFAQYGWVVSGTSSEATDVAKRLGDVAQPDQAMAGYAQGVVIQKAIEEAGSCEAEEVLKAVRAFSGNVLGIPIDFPASSPTRYGAQAESLQMAKVGDLQDNQFLPIE